MNYEPIIKFFDFHQGVCDEYSLLKHLQENQPEFFTELGESPSLYKKHFLLFHHLYLLNTELINQGERLIISALDIRRCKINHAGSEVGATDKLKNFYLDKNNLHISEAELIAMQQKFWQKYLALDKKSQAIKKLGLEDEPELNRKKLKKRFKELAQKHHPDKGGDEKFFIDLKEAYGELKLLLN